MRLLLLLALLFASPVAAQAEQPNGDPAVAYANRVGTGARYLEGWFGTGDTRLHYVEAGEGPLIILYHGFPSYWFSWFDQMEALKGRYRVVAVDGLGAGMSGKPADLAPYRVPALALQLDALARHLNGNRRFVLIGHDWGAALAFAYAAANPKRLNAVIGLSAPPFNQFLDSVRRDPEQQKRSDYMQFFRTLTLDDISRRKLPEAIWQQAYGALIARRDLNIEESELFRSALSDPRAIEGGMNWYRANMPPFAEIEASHYWPAPGRPIRVPALLIWGEADSTFVPAFLDDFKSYAPRGKIVRLPGINHWTPMERPAAANAAIIAFLDRSRRR